MKGAKEKPGTQGDSATGLVVLVQDCGGKPVKRYLHSGG